MPIVTLEDKLASGQYTQEEYDKRRKAVDQKRAWKAANGHGNGTGVKSANKSGTRKVHFGEDEVMAMVSDLEVIQAAIEQGDADENTATMLSEIVETLLTQVNPLKAQLPKLEQQKADLEIELAELNLAIAKADKEAVTLRRTKGQESKEAAEAGKALADLTTDRDAKQKTYMEVKNEWFKASR